MSKTEFENVSLTISDEHIAHVQLSRPEAHNAIDQTIFAGLLAVAKQLHDKKEVRVVVLSGEGKSFCAGIDMANFGDMAKGDLTGDSVADAYEDLSPAGANQAQQLGWMWQELPVPVIAAVQGAALGGGLNLALGADIRVVHPQAKLGFVEITWGLLPDMSATQAIRHLLPLDLAKSLVMTGRKFSGTEALDYGLATELSEQPLETAMDMATQIAGRSPAAVQAAKKLLNESTLLSVRDGLAIEANASRALLGTPEQIEAVMANFEKRAPNFGVNT